MNNQNLALGDDPLINDTEVDTMALIDEWNLSITYVTAYTRDLILLDTLVDGVPLNHDKDAPFVGDTSLGASVHSIPRNSLKQLPVFSAIVNGTKNSVPALICTFLLKRFIFNEDTFGKGLLSTLQIGAEQALSHGYAPFFVATGAMYNDFGTTMKLLHYMDTAPEPGITDANESGYHYVVANLAPSRVKKILRAAKANPNTSWNVKALELVLESAPRAKTYSIYESPVKRNAAGEAAGPAYKFITRFPVGSPDEPIITFTEDVTETPLRTMDQKSRFGYPRVQYLVVDPAALTPFGVSRVRRASPNQNFNNIYLGNVAAMLLLNSKPPLFVRGRFLHPPQLKQGERWQTLDPTASADLKTIDNGALKNFIEIQEHFEAKIQEIMENGSASSDSKTAPGVKQDEDNKDAVTNEITKILENFLRQYALVGLDTLISEQEGKETLVVDDDTKNNINQLSPGAIGDDNTFEMSWEDFYAAIKDWSVEITVSVSKDELADKKRGDIQDMLTVLAQNAAELGPNAAAAVDTLTNLLMQDLAPTVKPIPSGGPAPALGQPPVPGGAPGPAALPAPPPQ